MVTQTPTPFDFVAETNGQCFLCSDKISSWGLSHLSSIYSLHSLSRYLKMDMKKVFNVEGPLPPHLVTRVEKSNLKAELCQECTSLTKTFSGQLRQLEKIQMEVTSGLSLIHQKLERCLKKGAEVANSKTDDWVAKMKITESLRMEAMQKCSRKLSKVNPMAKLQRLTGNQVNAEKLKIKLYSVKAESNESNNYDHDHGEAIGSPASSPISIADGMDYQDEPNPSVDSAIDDANYGIRNEGLKQEAIKTSQYKDEPYYEDLSRDQEPYQPSPSPSSSSTVNSNDQQNERATDKNQFTKLSEAIPPPIKLVGNVGIELPKINLDPMTGKYKCGICSKEFSTKIGFQKHFDSVHLKVKHKCVVCNSKFSEKSKYERHYLNIHIGVRFKCGKCDKTFSVKASLMQHQNRVHLGE